MQYVTKRDCTVRRWPYGALRTCSPATYFARLYKFGTAANLVLCNRPEKVFAVFERSGVFDRAAYSILFCIPADI